MATCYNVAEPGSRSAPSPGSTVPGAWNTVVLVGRRAVAAYCPAALNVAICMTQALLFCVAVAAYEPVVVTILSSTMSQSGTVMMRVVNREVATIAEHAVASARRVALNARRGLRQRTAPATGKTVALLSELERTATLVERIAAQTRVRLAGEVPDGSVRVVSLHDPDARPITKGRLGRPVEFGYKAQVVDNADGVVLDHGLHVGNPPDAPLLVPAIARVIARFGRAPRAVTADRGYGEAAVDRDLDDLGVQRVIPPQGPARRRPPGHPARPLVPQARQVAHRQRGTHLLPQTRLRVAAHSQRWRDRRGHLVRLGRARPQRHQDQRPRSRSRTTTRRTHRPPPTAPRGGCLTWTAGRTARNAHRADAAYPGPR